MAWDWDHLTRNIHTSDEPRRGTRWTLSEAGIALLVVALLAGTALLAYLTGSPR
ncbi:MAG TPA: hypothetical protein VFH56_05335 [Acidimicrobiales bacterium]|nr:hypothetical protein [Acidimicrobiales bacterium]